TPLPLRMPRRPAAASRHLDERPEPTRRVGLRERCALRPHSRAHRCWNQSMRTLALPYPTGPSLRRETEHGRETMLAGDVGVEPTHTEPESAVLPLDESPA